MSSCAPGCGNKMIKMTPVTGYPTPNDLKFDMVFIRVDSQRCQEVLKNE